MWGLAGFGWQVLKISFGCLTGRPGRLRTSQNQKSTQEVFRYISTHICIQCVYIYICTCIYMIRIRKTLPLHPWGNDLLVHVKKPNLPTFRRWKVPCLIRCWLTTWAHPSTGTVPWSSFNSKSMDFFSVFLNTCNNGKRSVFKNQSVEKRKNTRDLEIEKKTIWNGKKFGGSSAIISHHDISGWSCFFSTTTIETCIFFFAPHLSTSQVPGWRMPKWNPSFGTWFLGQSPRFGKKRCFFLHIKCFLKGLFIPSDMVSWGVNWLMYITQFATFKNNRHHIIVEDAHDVICLPKQWF